MIKYEYFVSRRFGSYPAVKQWRSKQSIKNPA